MVNTSKGAIISGSFYLEKGSNIYVIVGQVGQSKYDGCGGTFVFMENTNWQRANIPLVIAGGAGGQGGKNDTNAGAANARNHGHPRNSTAKTYYQRNHNYDRLPGNEIQFNLPNVNIIN